jgi:carbon monoxide dehydrogenase subunit G
LAIEGEYRVNAPRQAVWDALNDAEVLKACIPGCEHIERKSDTEVEARIQAALGPVRSVFATRIELKDLNPPVSYTLTGEGKAAAGFGKGTARIELAEDAGATLLRYSAELRLGGKLAQVGSRLVEGATRQLADQFFDTFAKRLDAGAQRIEQPAPEGAGAGARLPWILLALALLGGLAWWLLSR